MLEIFRALLPYYGGKRKLAKKILNYAEGKVFIDAFMGGGSVSLLAKAKGYQVIANDIADRSAIVGKALVENEDILVEDSDIVRLFKQNSNSKHYIRDRQSVQFKPELADFLDNARANIDKINDPTKRMVMMLLWMKAICYYRPMAQFTHISAVEKLKEEDSDTAVLRRLEERYSQPLFKILNKLAEEVNAGIFTNGLENEVHQKDVIEFLPQVAGDTVYLDPPYYGAQSYEYHYNVLDSMLALEDIKPENSAFNSRQVLANMVKLFEACQHIPTWILSIGERIIDKNKYIELMSEYRSVEDIPVNHAYTTGIGYNEESGKVEVLLVGRAA
jgi:adenine-specific DNA methylase